MKVEWLVDCLYWRNKVFLWYQSEDQHGFNLWFWHSHIFWSWRFYTFCYRFWWFVAGSFWKTYHNISHYLFHKGQVLPQSCWSIWPNFFSLMFCLPLKCFSIILVQTFVIFRSLVKINLSFLIHVDFFCYLPQSQLMIISHHFNHVFQIWRRERTRQIQGSKNGNLEKVLLKWFCCTWADNIPEEDSTVKKKVNEIALKNINEF